mgnify:CR=1 FL=1
MAPGTHAVAAVCATLAIQSWVESFWASLLIAIGVMAAVSFAIVGVSPRTLGRQHSDGVALASAPVIIWCHRVLGPVARLLVIMANAVTPGRGFRDGPFTSESELRDLVDIAGESALIEDEEREMIHSVFELGDTIAREVMVPRTDMVCIEVGKHARQAMSMFNRSGFSRLPVIDNGPDDVVGLIYLKDVVRLMTAEGADLKTVPVRSIMRPMPFVPESKPVDDLLREMQRDSVHIAVVVDEYGGTAGLVTIEDILEEIVGEIDDEYDREAPGIEDLGDGRFRIPASMNVDDFGEFFDVDMDDEHEVDTVGGLIAKSIGRVPILGSRCEIERCQPTSGSIATHTTSFPSETFRANHRLSYGVLLCRSWVHFERWRVIGALFIELRRRSTLRPRRLRPASRRCGRRRCRLRRDLPD